MIKNCVICGKEFDTCYTKKTCCSDECKNIYIKLYYKQYYQEKKEHIAELTSTYYYNNKEIILEKAKDYYIKNREELITRAREYYKNNPPKDNPKRKKVRQIWRENNSEKIRLYNREYTKTPIGKLNLTINNHKRRAITSKSIISEVDYEFIKMRDGEKCQLCKKKIDFSLQFPHPLSLSYDHILPLSKGGSHSTANLQLAHFSCNSRKNNNISNGIQQNLF